MYSCIQTYIPRLVSFGSLIVSSFWCVDFGVELVVSCCCCCNPEKNIYYVAMYVGMFIVKFCSYYACITEEGPPLEPNRSNPLIASMAA